MKYRYYNRNKCKHCGHDIREIDDLIDEITELYDDVKSWIKEGTLEIDFDDYSLDQALKVALDIPEIRAYPTAVDEINKLRKLLEKLWWMERVQYHDIYLKINFELLTLQVTEDKNQLSDLGNITRISIRDRFPDEAHDFTPWLTKNLHRLGEKLKIDFTDGEKEVSVGRYSCDIFAHDSLERKIVIENQYDVSDHEHLGKVLTYSSGLEADIIIWVAEEFLPEHITALNWLNTIASEEEKPSFFAVQMGLIRIDDSRPALEFNPLVHPDEWSRKIKSERSYHNYSEKRKKYNNFWTNLIQHYEKNNLRLKNQNPPYKPWYAYGSGKTGLTYMFSFEEKIPTIGLYIDVRNEEENLAIFNKIKRHQHEIESKLPDLDWNDSKKAKYKSIDLYFDREYGFSDEDDEKEVLEWMCKKMKILDDIMTPIIQKI